MEFTWVNIQDDLITQELLDDFQSGNSVFDDFLKEKARDWQDYSEATTYVFVKSTDKEAGCISRIFGYVSINATGLMYKRADDSKLYLPCAEIRMFAIHKSLRKRHNPDNNFSEILFKMVLQELYYMSTHVIGFRAIFLNANDEGYQLYVNSGFEEVKGFLTPDEEEKMDLEGMRPLLLLINDDITDLLFC